MMRIDVFLAADLNGPKGISPNVNTGPKTGILLEDFSIRVPEESKEPNEKGADKQNNTGGNKIAPKQDVEDGCQKSHDAVSIDSARGKQS
jgi:hypothetical protein